jgi:hypothetical protein
LYIGTCQHIELAPKTIVFEEHTGVHKNNLSLRNQLRFQSRNLNLQEQQEDSTVHTRTLDVNHFDAKSVISTI